MINIFKRNPLAISIALVFVFVTAAYWISQTNQTISDDQPIMIATGSEGGMYSQFGEAVQQGSKLNFQLRNTKGSIENIELLRNRSVDYALVQSDIAQYSYYGTNGQEKFDELAYVLPVFPEYVQVILPEESDIEVLSALRGRRVCVGAPGSGTYFNSIDVMAEAGLRETVDFFPVMQNAFDCMEAIESGDTIDAIFSTSNNKIATNSKKFKQLLFADSMASSLATKHPHFRVEQTENEEGTLETQLVVDAYLATHSAQSSASANAVTEELVKNWDNYRTKLPMIPALDLSFDSQTIPFHAATDSTLINLGVKDSSNFLLIFSVGWLVVLFLSITSERMKTSYNRMGESSLSKAKHNFFVKFVGRFSQLFIGITFLILFIAAAVYLLRWTEDIFALQVGSQSPFARMSFTDNLIWLFAYITSGFTSNDIYPVSFMGKLITATLAIVGVAGPLAFVVYFINLANRQKQFVLQGLGSVDQSGHVVICGWNEKAPGIIYTLTSQEIGKRKKVVIVADLDDKYPLEKFRFDPSYVSYCKGDPSDSSTLERAGIDGARAAIILADFGNTDSHNTKSILATMNVRRLNEECYICAEIEHLDNLDHFYASGCDALIHPSRIARRMVLAAILDTRILDYVFDMVTFHAFDELYSITAQELFAARGTDNISIAELEHALFDIGVNLVGINQIQKERTAQTIDRGNAAFDTSGLSHALLDARDCAAKVEDDVAIIYSASNAKDIRSNRTDRQPIMPLSERRFGIEYPHKCSILVIGGKYAITNIRKQLDAVIDDLAFTSIDTTEHQVRHISQIKQMADGAYDKIVILTPHDVRTKIASFEQVNENDTDLILLTQLVRQAFPRTVQTEERERSGPEIICEIGNIQNRELMRKAGVDVIVPTTLMAERFFSKEAYDRNQITDFLMAAMNLKDGIHLHSHLVEEGDGFCGETYAQILRTPIDGTRIMGWLPFEQRDSLKNQEGDFGFHFRTVIDKRIKSTHAQQGDILIMMIEKRDEYCTANPEIVKMEPQAAN